MLLRRKIEAPRKEVSAQSVAVAVILAAGLDINMCENRIEGVIRSNGAANDKVLPFAFSACPRFLRCGAVKERVGGRPMIFLSQMALVLFLHALYRSTRMVCLQGSRKGKGFWMRHQRTDLVLS